MTDEDGLDPVAVGFDVEWLNDRSDYQRNFVHGLRNRSGLGLQYGLERLRPDADPPPPRPDPMHGFRVVGTWVAGDDHMGFPGVAHGGLVAAVLDDVIGRCAALRHQWVMTARLETRFRGPALIGVPLRVEGWLTRWRRRLVVGEGRIRTPDGVIAAEATGTYMPFDGPLRDRMLTAWPGFADYLGGDVRPVPSTGERRPDAPDPSK